MTKMDPQNLFQIGLKSNPTYFNKFKESIPLEEMVEAEKVIKVVVQRKLDRSERDRKKREKTVSEERIKEEDVVFVMASHMSRVTESTRLELSQDI